MPHPLPCHASLTALPRPPRHAVFPASTAALAYALEPLFAALFAAMFLGEDLSVLQLLGGALVISANIVAAMRSRGVP